MPGGSKGLCLVQQSGNAVAMLNISRVVKGLGEEGQGCSALLSSQMIVWARYQWHIEPIIGVKQFYCSIVSSNIIVAIRLRQPYRLPLELPRRLRAQDMFEELRVTAPYQSHRVRRITSILRHHNL